MDLLNLCRACMRDGNYEEDWISDEQVMDMFSFCTKVTDDDRLPKNFCTKCSELLKVTYNFICQARHVDLTLKDIASRSETRIIVEPEKSFSTLSSSYADSKESIQEDVDEKDFYYKTCDQSFNDDTDYCEEEQDTKICLEVQKYEDLDIKSDGENLEIKFEEKPAIVPLGIKLVKNINYKRKGLKRKKKTQLSFEEHACSICGKVFAKKRYLQQHQAVHSDDKPFPCHLCPKRFKMRNLLNAHLKLHTDPKSFKCDICGLSFNIKTVLITHMTTHMEVKPHLCHLCGHEFALAGNLKVHMRTHTGEKPFKCSKCSFTCAVSTSLRRHEQRHGISVKSYGCTRCGKSFNDPSSLSRHIRIHTGDLPYKCWVCPAAFIDSWKRKNHVMKQHQVALEDLPALTKGRRKSIRTNNCAVTAITSSAS